MRLFWLALDVESPRPDTARRRDESRNSGEKGFPGSKAMSAHPPFNTITLEVLLFSNPTLGYAPRLPQRFLLDGLSRAWVEHLCPRDEMLHDQDRIKQKCFGFPHGGESVKVVNRRDGAGVHRLNPIRGPRVSPPSMLANQPASLPTQSVFPTYHHCPGGPGWGSYFPKGEAPRHPSISGSGAWVYRLDDETLGTRKPKRV